MGGGSACLSNETWSRAFTGTLYKGNISHLPVEFPQPSFPAFSKKIKKLAKIFRISPCLIRLYIKR
jgi:hypothetical protein